MQGIMTEPKQSSLRSIIDKYSPVVRGMTGLAGKALSLATRPFEKAANAAQTLWRWPDHGAENKAGQYITDCNASIFTTFQRMEKKLTLSFNAAVNDGARRRFLSVVDDVKRDAAVLEQHCTILRQPYDIVRENYKFILGTGTAVTLLSDAVGTVKAQLAPRENPVTIRRAPQPQAQATTL